MGLESRGYQAGSGYDDGYGGGGGFRGGGVPGVRGNIPQVCLWLLAINVVVFLVTGIVTNSARAGALSPANWGTFSFDKAVAGFQVWRLVTYQFMHADFFHLLFNMIGLWVFGSMIERRLGAKRFLAFYLLCGVAGALLYGLSGFVPAIAQTQLSSGLVGASACVLGCVAGVMVWYPRDPIRLFLIPLEFTMLALGGLYIGLDVLQVIAGGPGAGSAVAHLGGAAMGFVFARRIGLLGWAESVNVSATDAKQRFEEGQWARKQKALQAQENELDTLLAKVSEQGLGGLSEKEKKRLNQLSAAKRDGR